MFVLDIDECSIGSDTCLENSTCVNAAGSFRCFCNKGFTGDGSKACYGMYAANSSSCYVMTVLESLIYQEFFCTWYSMKSSMGHTQKPPNAKRFLSVKMDKCWKNSSD